MNAGNVLTVALCQGGLGEGEQSAGREGEEEGGERGERREGKGGGGGGGSKKKDDRRREWKREGRDMEEIYNGGEEEG